MRGILEIAENVREWLEEDWGRKTAVLSSLSALMNLFFLVFNAVLGLMYSSLWHGSISVYYALLFIVRTIIVMHQRRGESNHRRNRNIYILTHILLLIMNVSLIVPIAMMIEGNRSYTHGLIPAIAMATYTTYRVTMAIMNAVKSKRGGSPFTSELRTINFLDAMLSVLTLQNALIIATDGMNEDMHTLMSWTSGGIWLLIVVVTVLSFRKIRTLGKEN